MKKILTIFLCAVIFIGTALLTQGCGSQDRRAGQEAAEGNTPENSLTPDTSRKTAGGFEAGTKEEAPDGNAEDAGPGSPSEAEDAKTASGPACPSANGALHVDGTRLADKNGNPVQLRGISTHGLAWFPDYVNEACFGQLHDEWKANVIRLAMYTAEYGGYCTDGDRDYLKQLIQNGVDYAKKQDMYVIVDWHILSDSNPNTYVEESKAFFKEIAGKYADEEHILYEICNEPNGGTTWADIKAYAAEVIPAIRSEDEDAVILVGTPNWSQFVDQAVADPITGYDNLMYTLHFYAATHTDDLRAKMTEAVGNGLPVFVSEYGICDASGSGAIDETQANLWVEAMNGCGISYVAWNLSNKEETSAILQSTCTKSGPSTQDDLSASGKWLYQMLTSAGSD